VRVAELPAERRGRHLTGRELDVLTEGEPERCDRAAAGRVVARVLADQRPVPHPLAPLVVGLQHPHGFASERADGLRDDGRDVGLDLVVALAHPRVAPAGQVLRST
jgi:hypothetical protein